MTLLSGSNAESLTRNLKTRLEQQSGCNITMATDACVDGLKILKVKRLGIISPYMPEPSNRSNIYFSEQGFEIINHKPLICSEPAKFAEVTENEIYRALLAGHIEEAGAGEDEAEDLRPRDGDVDAIEAEQEVDVAGHLGGRGGGHRDQADRRLLALELVDRADPRALGVTRSSVGRLMTRVSSRAAGVNCRSGNCCAYPASLNMQVPGLISTLGSFFSA